MKNKFDWWWELIGNWVCILAVLLVIGFVIYAVIRGNPDYENKMTEVYGEK